MKHPKYSIGNGAVRLLALSDLLLKLHIRSYSDELGLVTGVMVKFITTYSPMVGE